ncbi:MAG: flagellar biosynthetic protein FliO [Thermodesulfobacteriota bacterium]|nr:flagellar biosynthetic protein FliO [Thermodesulfobacteriota bacterium]
MSIYPEIIPTAIKMLTALGMVLGGMLVVYYFSKRILKRQAGHSKGRMIKVLESSYIGVKKNISLVEIPGAILVLGITNDHISLLSKIENQEVINGCKEVDQEKEMLSFSDRLHHFSSKLKGMKSVR